jgi:predicted metal-binding protein
VSGANPSVIVCTTCRRPDDAEDAPRAGAALAAALQAAADPAAVTIRPVECLANCQRGPSAALSRRGAWTYVFGGLAAPDDAAALLEGARLLAASDNGLLPWRGRPDILKRGMICRIPPMEVPA